MMEADATTDTTHARRPRFVCDDCGDVFASQSDIDRHRSGVHEKNKPHFCDQPGCRRSKKGFTRKDNYEVHRRQVHKIKGTVRHASRHGNSAPPSTTLGDSISSGGAGEWARHSRDELVEALIREQEKRRAEERRRRESEEELANLRRRYEEREDRWLRILAKD